MDYIDWLSEHSNWLVGKRLSLADLAAAAHLSVLDFLGDIDWVVTQKQKTGMQK